MKPKSALTKLAPLLNAPHFTAKAAKTMGVSAATLSHYVQSGDLIRIGYGLYRGAQIPAIDDFRWEDLIDTVIKVKQGVVCLTSALALYELTDEIPRQHWIAIPNETSHHADAATKIIRLRNIELGKTVIELGVIKLPIFNRERTIVDAFRFLSLETAVKALRNGLKLHNADKLDLLKIRSYAKTLRVNIEPYLLGILSE